MSEERRVRERCERIIEGAIAGAVAFGAGDRHGPPDPAVILQVILAELGLRAAIDAISGGEGPTRPHKAHQGDDTAR